MKGRTMEHNAHHHTVMGIHVTEYNTLEGVITEYAIYSRMRWMADAQPIVEYTRDGGLMLAIYRNHGWDVIFHNRACDLAAPLDALRRVDEHLEALEQSLADEALDSAGLLAPIPLPPANPTVELLALALSIPRGMAQLKRMATGR